MGRDWRLVGAGSSPRVRGKAAVGGAMHGKRGIIPAGAGKSRYTPKMKRRPRDHPRGCGEKIHSSRHPTKGEGSSPRVRGKDAHARTLYPLGGIIPAGAGKRTVKTAVAGAKWDHPRGCGEKTTTAPGRSSKQGSSPRVRGKGGAIEATYNWVGIIPAGAGKRPAPSPLMGGGLDHPRGCGEKPPRNNQTIN